LQLQLVAIARASDLSTGNLQLYLAHQQLIIQQINPQAHG